jgi:polyferredoxin
MITKFLSSSRNRNQLTLIPTMLFSIIYLIVLLISPINQFGSYFIDGEGLTPLSYVMIPLFLWIMTWCLIFLLFDVYLYHRRHIS